MALLHYFNGRGRAETTRWMLAINQIKFGHNPVDSPQALENLRETGKLPFDQLPLLEIDQLNLSQSSAMVRYLARHGGYYGDGDHEALLCDMVAGAVGDFAETALQAAFQPSAEIAVASLRARFAKFAPRFEAMLQKNQTGYTATRVLSFADILLCEALYSYHEWCPDLLSTCPLLEDLYSRVISEPGIAQYLQSDNHYPKPGDDYVIETGYVLSRALPAHMPDHDRFVVK